MDSAWRFYQCPCDPWYSPSMLRATSDGLVHYLSYTWHPNQNQLKREENESGGKKNESNNNDNSGVNVLRHRQQQQQRCNGMAAIDNVNNRCQPPLVGMKKPFANTISDKTIVGSPQPRETIAVPPNCTFVPLPPMPLPRSLPLASYPCGGGGIGGHKRFCQTKIMELWQLLSSNLVKAERTLYGDLWLPPNESDFEIDFKTGDTVKTILALRTPVWPPNVTKILLICVKKIPCGKDDSCIRRLRDQTRWMKNDLQNHVAAYKSFRQLKYNSFEYWYLPRHICEFNLERFINSTLYSPVTAEFLVRDLFHGLNYLHMQAQHLFHGNLKPSNVLIDLKSDNRLSLILVDFGFGRLRCPRIGLLNEICCCHATAPATAMGGAPGLAGVPPPTRKMNDLCWKPPEFFDLTDRWPPSPKYDTPSDVYSAALLSYFMMTRRHAFVNRADMIMLHLRRAMHEECYILDAVDVEVQAILRPLFCRESKLRPRAADVLKQPLCWAAESRAKFLTRVADALTQKSCLESRVGDALSMKPWRQFDDWSRQMPEIVRGKVYAVLNAKFHSSLAAWLLAVNFYRQAKRNNEIPQSFVCPCLPDDEHQFFMRYPNLFWDVYRIVNSDTIGKISKSP